MLTSIIIPAYNAASTLRECLEACLRQTHREIEVIVVDDGSTDGTPEVVRDVSQNACVAVHYMRQENRGPAAARNRGAAKAVGEFLAFTDADCVPHADWIERLLAGFDTGVVAAGGTYGIANPGRLLARMVHEEIAARHATFGDEVDFLGSFNAMYRLDAFEAVGGFDESFRMASAEDNDFAYRLQDAGGRLRFVKDAIVDHYHPTRLLPYLRTQAWHGYWRMKLYAKHVKRAQRGDRYAGPSDLHAPLLAFNMFTLGLLLLAIAPRERPSTVYLAAAGVWLIVALLYAATRVSLTLRVFRRAPHARMLLFMGVAFVRDLARVSGMTAGMVRFFVLRGRNA